MRAAARAALDAMRVLGVAVCGKGGAATLGHGRRIRFDGRAKKSPSFRV